MAESFSTFSTRSGFSTETAINPSKISFSLAKQQHQINIKRQQQLDTHNYFNGGQLFWLPQSPVEATITHYTNPGGNNNSDETRTVFAPDAVCFVKNNGRRIMNKWNVPVRRVQKGIFYPFSKHDPSYLSKFPLNFNGCFICGSTNHHDKNMCPTKDQTGAMDALYRELNIHKLNTDLKNKKNWRITLCRPSQFWTSKYMCCTQCGNMLY